MRSFFKDDDEQSRCRKVETETVRDDTVNCLNRVGVSGSRAGRVFVSEPGGSVFLPTHRRSELFFSFFHFCVCLSNRFYARPVGRCRRPFCCNCESPRAIKKEKKRAIVFDPVIVTYHKSAHVSGITFSFPPVSIVRPCFVRRWTCFSFLLLLRFAFGQITDDVLHVRYRPLALAFSKRAHFDWRIGWNPYRNIPPPPSSAPIPRGK